MIIVICIILLYFVYIFIENAAFAEDVYGGDNSEGSIGGTTITMNIIGLHPSDEKDEIKLDTDKFFADQNIKPIYDRAKWDTSLNARYGYIAIQYFTLSLKSKKYYTLSDDDNNKITNVYFYYYSKTTNEKNQRIQSVLNTAYSISDRKYDFTRGMVMSKYKNVKNYFFGFLTKDNQNIFKLDEPSVIVRTNVNVDSYNYQVKYTNSMLYSFEFTNSNFTNTVGLIPYIINRDKYCIEILLQINKDNKCELIQKNSNMEIHPYKVAIEIFKELFNENLDNDRISERMITYDSTHRTEDFNFLLYMDDSINDNMHIQNKTNFGTVNNLLIDDSIKRIGDTHIYLSFELCKTLKTHLSQDLKDLSILYNIFTYITLVAASNNMRLYYPKL